jgi:carbamate kinase
MLPKIQAVVDFLEGGGTEAIITDPEHLAEALKGRAGTRVVR